MKRAYKRLFSQLLRQCHVDLADYYAFDAANGGRFWLHDEVESHSMWIDSGQPKQDDLAIFLLQYLREGSIFVDIGANIGRYAILASRLVGSTGKVCAFEPAPSAFRALEQNVRLNRAENVQAFCLAVAEAQGCIELWQDRRNSALSSAVPRLEAPRPHSIRCCSITGTQVLRLTAGPRIDVLKIDVEGAEFPVLRSFGEALAHIPCVLFECSRANFARTGYSSGDLLSYLRSFGHTIYQLGRAGGKPRVVNSPTYDTTNTDLVAALELENLKGAWGPRSGRGGINAAFCL